MNEIFKITSAKINKKEILNRIKNNEEDIIDLSELNIFDTAKTIIMISTYATVKDNQRKFRYKVSTPNIKNILNDIPLNCAIELI